MLPTAHAAVDRSSLGLRRRRERTDTLRLLRFTLATIVTRTWPNQDRDETRDPAPADQQRSDLSLMASLRTRLAAGARWTISIRVVERIIGFVSTLILARLLAPQDFGVVAMGTAIHEILAAITAFGFSQALIRMHRRNHAAYSTAFTLQVITGSAIALVLVASIPLAARWYGDPRVTDVLVILALTSFVGGFRNAGMVRYERALDFRPFFVIALARKISSFSIGAICALIWGDYRALLAGMLLGAIVETGITYRLTRFRPRFTLSRWRELLGFSVWWLGSQTATMLGRRGQDVLVGQRLGAESLGQYAVALDLATMATAEIVYPVMRAMYPGYIRMRDDPGRLFSAYVRVWGVIALLAIPAAAGTACLSPMITDVVLGPKWAAAAPMMALLAAVGAVHAMGACYSPVLLTCVGPRANFTLSALGFALGIPAFAISLWQAGLMAAIWAYLGAMVICLIVGARMIVRNLRRSYLPMLRALVRPVVGASVMSLSLLALLPLLPVSGQWAFKALVLLLLVAFGALIYTATVVGLWLLAGRPQAAESELFSALADRTAHT